MTSRKLEDMFPLSPVQDGMLPYALHVPGAGVHMGQVSWSVSGFSTLRRFARRGDA